MWRSTKLVGNSSSTSDSPKLTTDTDTRIADRAAELSQKHAAGTPVEEPPLVFPPPPTVGKRTSKVLSPAPTESLAQIRQDLAKAQQERAELQGRVDTAARELDALKAKSKTDTKRIAQLSAGITQMTVRLRDRDEELKGKAKLLEDVQDEVVTLNLQLNMAEEQAKMLRKENEELVDRWMARMGKEADAMNDESKFR